MDSHNRNFVIYSHHKLDWDSISYNADLWYEILDKFRNVINWEYFLYESYIKKSILHIDDIVDSSPDLFRDSWGLLIYFLSNDLVLKYHHKIDFRMPRNPWYDTSGLFKNWLVHREYSPYYRGARANGVKDSFDKRLTVSPGSAIV